MHRPELLDEESREALYDRGIPDQMRFRKVRLMSADIVLVDAVNWYFPANLPADICRQLDVTNIPFGRLIRPLKPTRRTFLVRRCAPRDLDRMPASIDPDSIVFEHRAVVCRQDGAPLAVVHERFHAVLVQLPFCESATLQGPDSRVRSMVREVGPALTGTFR